MTDEDNQLQAKEYFTMSTVSSLRLLFFGVTSVCILFSSFQHPNLRACFPAERNEKPGGKLKLPEGFSLRDLKDVTDALIKKMRVVAPETVIVLSVEIVKDNKILVSVGLENALDNGYFSYALHKDPKKKIWEIESGEAAIE